MTEVDLTTVLNIFLRLLNLERMLTSFLDGTIVQKREEESLKPVLPAIGISIKQFRIYSKW